MPKEKTRAYYLCDELDCGFRYTYKKGRGPSKNHPIIDVNVFVKDLNKKVRISFVGFEEEGLKKLQEHGHDGYIFPVNLFNHPYCIDPTASKTVKQDQHENWLKLISSYKGITHISDRKKYVLVANDGTIIGKSILSQQELDDKLEFQRKWQVRHPDESPASWIAEDEHKERSDVSVLHTCISQ